VDTTGLRIWNATTATWVQAENVQRSPQSLNIHPALQAMSGLTLMPEADNWEQLSKEPIFITSTGLVLAGFGRFQIALAQNEAELTCVQIELSLDDALIFILRHHQPRRGWNAFIRIRVALNLESGLKERALENMRAGGRFKGSPNLAKADHLEVRREIGRLAGSGKANVDKVKTILARAHPNIIAAIENGVVTIHKAWKWCSFPKQVQQDSFDRHEEEQNKRKVLREFRRSGSRVISDPKAFIAAIEDRETENPGSIIFRASGGRKHTLVLLGDDVLLPRLDPQSEQSS
jgi:hypothetical protein